MSCYGTCKTFVPKNGWGFITDSEGADVFFHADAVSGRPPQVGDSLVFDKAPSPVKPGQLMAVNIQGGTAGGSQEGVIKSYNGSHGYGFVEFGGATIFLHASEVKGNMPQAGDVVCFDVEQSPLDPKKQVAVNVVGGTGMPIGKFLNQQEAERNGKGKGKGKEGKGKGKGFAGKGAGAGWGGDTWGAEGGDDDWWGMMSGMMGMMKGKGDGAGKGKGGTGVGAAGKGPAFGAAGKGACAAGKAAGPYGKGGNKGAKGFLQ